MTYRKIKDAGTLLILAVAVTMSGADACGAEAKVKTRAKAKTVSVAETLERGRGLFENYRFEEAAEQASAARRAAKEDNDVEDAEELSDQIRLGENFLSRVEKLVILDSIAVPKAGFFKAYRLPSSAGTLGSATARQRSVADSVSYDSDASEYLFTNEGDNFRMWAEQDSTGFYRIMESNRLTDGSWSPAHTAPEELAGGGNAAWPFMMADGVTLYYAADGEESLGGYDIFVATRDAQTGEYMQPQNIGMPYNSPFDDYLLAIDEENGVGWWATDRNSLGDKLTVYLFKTNDLRRNYDADDENLADAARIARFRDSWGEEDDWTDLVRTVRSIEPEVRKKRDFSFPMGNGVTYTTLSDFKTNAGRLAMKKYLAAEKTYSENMVKLGELRRRYAQGASDKLRNSISRLETWTETERETLAKLRSDVYKAELRKEKH